MTKDVKIQDLHSIIIQSYIFLKPKSIPPEVNKPYQSIFNLMLLLIPLLKGEGKGSIVNISCYLLF